MKTKCCFCQREGSSFDGELFGDLVINKDLYFERYYHRKCKVREERLEK